MSNFNQHISYASFLEEGNAELIRDKFEQWEKKGEKNPDFLNDLALVKFACGKKEQAIKILEKLVKSHPQRSFATINLYYIKKFQTLYQTDKVKNISERIEFIKKDMRNFHPKISILMPTYNRLDIITKAIKSVLKQTFKNFELIVINDGGDENLLKIINSIWDNRIVYIYIKHCGLSGALNVGLNIARGEYIAYLDDDDIYYPHHLQTALEALITMGGKVVYTDTYRIFQKKIENGFQTIHQEPGPNKEFDKKALKRENYIPILSLVHHRECMKKIGYFDENLEHAMDWDFLIRLSKVYDFIHIPVITGEYSIRKDKSQMSFRDYEIINYFRNLILYKHNFFPLVSLRKFSSQGNGNILELEMARLTLKYPELIKKFELRMLFLEKYYSFFYRLGKKSLQESKKHQAQDILISALKLSKFEPKIYLKLFRSFLL